MSRRIQVHQVGDPTRANLSVDLRDSHSLFKVGKHQHRLRLWPGKGKYLDDVLAQHAPQDPDGGFSIPVEGRKK